MQRVITLESSTSPRVLLRLETFHQQDTVGDTDQPTDVYQPVMVLIPVSQHRTRASDGQTPASPVLVDYQENRHV